jgi:hypothetical protein
MSQASAYSRILAPSCWSVWSGQPSGGQAIVDLRDITPPTFAADRPEATARHRPRAPHARIALSTGAAEPDRQAVALGQRGPNGGEALLVSGNLGFVLSNTLRKIGLAVIQAFAAGHVGGSGNVNSGRRIRNGLLARNRVLLFGGNRGLARRHLRSLCNHASVLVNRRPQSRSRRGQLVQPAFGPGRIGRRGCMGGLANDSAGGSESGSLSCGL